MILIEWNARARARARLTDISDPRIGVGFRASRKRDRRYWIADIDAIFAPDVGTRSRVTRRVLVVREKSFPLDDRDTLAILRRKVCDAVSFCINYVHIGFVTTLVFGRFSRAAIRNTTDRENFSSPGSFSKTRSLSLDHRLRSKVWIEKHFSSRFKIQCT